MISLLRILDHIYSASTSPISLRPLIASTLPFSYPSLVRTCYSTLVLSDLITLYSFWNHIITGTLSPLGEWNQERDSDKSVLNSFCLSLCCSPHEFQLFDMFSYLHRWLVSPVESRFNLRLLQCLIHHIKTMQYHHLVVLKFLSVPHLCTSESFNLPKSFSLYPTLI